jgi:hypothetical protein
MEEIKLTYRELLMYIVTANVILGLLFGSISLILGFKQDRKGLGALGCVATVLGGAVAGVFLSYPITLLFLWLLLRQPRTVVAPAETSTFS